MSTSRHRRTAGSPEKPSKLLDPRVLDEAAHQVIGFAKQHRIRTALVGGLALQHHGSARLTGDVDIISAAAIPGIPKLRSLTFGGEGIKAPNGVPVCVIRRQDDYHKLYRSALVHAVVFHGLPTAPLEYIAAMKLAAGRTKDLADLEFLVSSKKLNIGLTREIVYRYVGGAFAVDSFDSIVLEIEWKMRAGKL